MFRLGQLVEKIGQVFWQSHCQNSHLSSFLRITLNSAYITNKLNFITICSQKTQYFNLFSSIWFFLVHFSPLVSSIHFGDALGVEVYEERGAYLLPIISHYHCNVGSFFI